MTSPFAVLGLTEETDAATVKRAYAALLRRFRPDEDPLGFQQLNDAYKSCLHALEFSLVQIEREVPPADEALPESQQHELLSDSQAPDQDLLLVDTDDGDYRLLEQIHAKAMDAPVLELQGWLQQHEGWYSILRRQELAPTLVQRLLEQTPLPPGQLEAVLQFFHLDALRPSEYWLQHQVAVLRSHSEDAFAEEQSGYTLQQVRDAESQQSDGPMIAILLKLLMFIMLAGGLHQCSAAMH